jgi:hypothetical protein
MRLIFISVFAESASASHGSFRVSAERYRRSEDVRVIAVVIAELELSNVQRQILAAED